MPGEAEGVIFMFGVGRGGDRVKDTFRGGGVCTSYYRAYDNCVIDYIVVKGRIY